jgi:RimJ/RimL family protein N-acetyltransferase
MSFVPDDFEVPTGLDAGEFRLEPLGPQHNEADYAAWTSSMEHIHATPGFEGRPWPHPMPAEENLSDLNGHAKDFADRTGFTYTVLASEDGQVIGCVYIYPAKPGDGADVRSWVRADRASLDGRLYATVASWLADSWPFETVSYAPR